ncbi:MAG: hypothetical protein IKQ91_04200, partial [Oscillospiraceae bacterium]|nr:hypothetical protein [Oscillospiraceae bacterium]
HEGQAVAEHIGSCIHRMEFHSHVHLLHILISFSVDGTLIRMQVSVFLRSGQAADRKGMCLHRHHLR